MSDKKHCAYCPGESYSHDPAAISWARGDRENDERRALAALEARVRAETWREAIEAAVPVIRRYLQFESQRAVSWHEVNDAIDAIRALSPPPEREDAAAATCATPIRRGGLDFACGTCAVCAPASVATARGEAMSPALKLALQNAGNPHTRPPADAKAATCATCNDTHRMTLGEREVMCTRCPTPCGICSGGAYCKTTPCDCDCHRRPR